MTDLRLAPKAGDIVRIKSWEQLASEYKVEMMFGREERIYLEDLHIYFAREMRQYCGKEFEVFFRRVYSSGIGTNLIKRVEVGLKDLETGEPIRWNWVPEMMVVISSVADLPEVSKSDLIAILGGAE